jgi:type IV secretory pathway VirB10-like protein
MSPRVGDRVRRLLGSGSSGIRQASAQSGFAAAAPIAKRLNRNALTVAAVVMGMTVIASLVVLRGDTSSAANRVAPAALPSETTAPTFLDRPATLRLGASPVSDSLQPSSPAMQANRSAAPPLAPATSVSGGDVMRSVPLNPDYSQLASSLPQAAAVDSRRQAFAAALHRSAIGSGGGNASSPNADIPGVAGVSSTSLAAEEARLVAYGDSVMRSATQRAGPLAPSAGGMMAANPRRAFMQQAGDLGGTSVAARLEPTGSRFVLRAGSVIPAVLLTAITSDLPGECLGQVSRDVFDTRSQRVLLIPKGSKLMCRYDDQVVAGQGRLLVAWTRLLLPDGRSMSLPGLALKDVEGQTGARGDIDNHTRRVFGRALLLSAIGAGTQLSQPRQASILAAPSTGQVVAGAVGQELSNVALEVIRRGLDQAPTITVPQGRTFNVFLNGDLVFDGPYVPTP